MEAFYDEKPLWMIRLHDGLEGSPDFLLLMQLIGEEVASWLGEDIPVAEAFPAAESVVKAWLRPWHRGRVRHIELMSTALKASDGL